MPSILFYTSIKTRVRDQESLMVEFVRQGNKVFFLNQQVNTYLPAICKGVGVLYSTTTHHKGSSTIASIVHQCLQLMRFIRSNKVDVVYSHLEPANFTAVLIQYFVKARIIIVRHHLDLAVRVGFSNDLSYRLTYKLAKDIIVVSRAAKEYMVIHEKVPERKIHHINLGYDFSIFGTVNTDAVNRLKKRLNARVLLVTVGRLDKYKRPLLSIEVLKKLLTDGIQSHLFLLGSGELKDELFNFVTSNGLQENVDFLGYQDNVLDYLSVADWLLHPSISESSCVVVKEASMVELPIIVCKGVGDFDDYLENEVNSILVNSEYFVDEAVKEIKKLRASQLRLSLGKKLKEDIMNRFSIGAVISEYKKFHN